MSPVEHRAAADPNRASQRPGWKSVAVPNEHGGWGLTLEPVLLGLMVAPTTAGALIGLMALLGFVARTPLKTMLVDARRGRELERTALARKILTAELLVLVGLAGFATLVGDARLWLPTLVAAPLILVELWFDMRSRGRKLVPELAGAIGVSSVAAMIVLADQRSIGLAAALWMILSARAITSIPFVRAQIATLRGRETNRHLENVADLVALGSAAVAVAIERSTLPGAALIAGVVVYQRFTGLRPPARVVTLGVRQTVLGLTLVLVTALGVLSP